MAPSLAPATATQARLPGGRFDSLSGHGPPLHARLLANVEAMLTCGCVHADLSAYNVLYWQGEITIIDFPQAVDAHLHPGAYALLERDVARLCRYFARYGVEADAAALTAALWARFGEPLPAAGAACPAKGMEQANA